MREYYDSLIEIFPFSSMSCQTSITIKHAYRLAILPVMRDTAYNFISD